MRELSIFIDESGDAAFRSDFYLVTLVFHRQDEPIQPNIAQYECTLTKELLDTIPFHFNPLLNGQDDYKWKDIRSRTRQLHAFRIFAEHLPIAYAAFVFEKRSRVTNTAQLTRAIEADVKGLLRSKQAYLQDFDQVKIYYDDGQSIVTKALHLAIEGAISSQAAVYKDASPQTVPARASRRLSVRNRVDGCQVRAAPGNANRYRIFRKYPKFQEELPQKDSQKAAQLRFSLLY